MMSHNDLDYVCSKLAKGNPSKVEMRGVAEAIRNKMNPHPAKQKEENVPRENGAMLSGMQHKYRETVLFFPSEVWSPCI